MAVHGRALDVHPVTPDRWDDLVSLFERPGVRGGRQDTANCWCAVWRGRSGSVPKKQALHDRVEAEDVPGLLAYRDGEPVGWVSVAPREHFAGLLRSSRFKPRDEDAGVFVITCFAVDPARRRQGIGSALVAGAVDYALDRGASAIEAYPADPPDYKGRPAWFREHGFVPVREIGQRTLVRYTPG